LGRTERLYRRNANFGAKHAVHGRRGELPGRVEPEMVCSGTGAVTNDVTSPARAEYSRLGHSGVCSENAVY
jgi:hypothetical protein